MNHMKVLPTPLSGVLKFFVNQVHLDLFWLFVGVGVMGEFIVRALFLAHKLLLVSFLSFF